MKPLSRTFALFTIMIGLVMLVFGGTASASNQEQTFEQPILVVNTSFLNVRTGPSVSYTTLVTVVGGTELPVLGVYTDGVWYQVNTDGGPGWVNVEFTLPRGDFTNVPELEIGEIGAANFGQGGGGDTTTTTTATSGVGFTQGFTLTSTNLRTSPDSNSLLLTTAAPIDSNTIYPLVNVTNGVDGTVWYQVNVPSIGTGWADQGRLRILACNGESVGVVNGFTPIVFDGIENRDSFLLEPQTEGLVGGFADGTSNRVFFTLPDGTLGIVPVDSYTLRTANNVCDGVGTVAPSVSSLGQGGGGDTTTTTTVVVPTLGGNTVIVNTGFLNVRSGPLVSFSTIATVPGGTELTVLGRAEDNVWFLVEGSFGQGWINNQFTLFRGDYASVPVITEPVIISDAGVPVTSTDLGQGGGAIPAVAGTITTGRSVRGASLVGKDMHAEPTYDSLIVNSAVPNDATNVYPLLATQVVEGTIWYLMDVPGVGRGWMDAVFLRPLQCGTDSVGLVPGQAPITFDGIANRDSFLLAQGTEFYITGRRNTEVIVELADGTVGLVNENNVELREGVTSDCTGVTTTTSATTVATTTTTTTTTATTTSNTPQLAGNRVVINTGNLNVRSGPSASFSTVATVPGGTELAVTGRSSDGVWYFVEGTFGTGWVNSEFTIFRGDYSTVAVISLSN
ncbi:MAG: SH3 domain-containing protein [Chloroflexota bacterium]